MNLESFRPTRRTAWLAVATVATLLLSIVFDLTVFATTLYPALWIAFGGLSRCPAPSATA
ncbi:hypothetical protein [Lysobacter xanthus]